MTLNPETPVSTEADIPPTLKPALRDFVEEQFSGVSIRTETGSVTLHQKLQQELGELYPEYQGVVLTRVAYLDTYDPQLPSGIINKRRVYMKGVMKNAEEHGLSHTLVLQADAKARDIHRLWKERENSQQALAHIGKGENPHVHLGDNSSTKNLGYIQGQQEPKD